MKIGRRNQKENKKYPNVMISENLWQLSMPIIQIILKQICISITSFCLLKLILK